MAWTRASACDSYLISLLLDLAEWSLQATIVIDVDRHIMVWQVARFMQIQFVAVHPAL
jgi:hypothetical protein